jgi:lipid II:glycine glycyltransferase (peptidoglycan interpeptide bridge formation enzyme)
MHVKQVEIDWNPSLSIYASESFLKAVGDEYGWIGGTDDSGKLLCVLPYTIIRKAIFRMVRFRVETIPLGEELDIRVEKSFLNSAIQFFRSTDADMIIPATTNTIFRTYPDGAIVAPYGTYIIDLSQPEEILWSNFSSSHRRKVRLAKKKGVKIRSGLEYFDTAYELIRDTLKRSALPFMGYDAFKRMLSGLGKNVKIFVSDYQGVVQGCAVISFSNHSAYYVYGGSIPEPITGANNLLHWEAILQFCGLGVRRYDFVGVRIRPEKGSKQEGLTMFKQRFGGQLVQGYMWKYSLHPMKFAVYSLAVRLLRGGDIVDQERHKLKNL